MPIHVRAEPGDYAEACLLPGDPAARAVHRGDVLRRCRAAKRRARDARLHGNLGGQADLGAGDRHGLSRRRRSSWRSSMQLGVKRFVRVGTCGGLQPDMQLGDMIVALSAVPADRTVDTYVDHEPHCPTASWELVHGAVHAAKEIGQDDARRADRLERRLLQPRRAASTNAGLSRGVLAVEMEAAVLFTIGALRDVHAGCAVDRQRRRRRGRVQADHRRRAARRGRPDDARRAGNRDGRLINAGLPRQSRVGQRRDRTALASARERRAQAAA